MALIGETNAEKIWNFLVSNIHNEYGVAALMGNLDAESGLDPKNMENSYEKKLNFNDASYTAAVDNGSYTNFIKDAVGYGIAQWTYYTRKQNLYVYAKSVKKTSIGDLEAQLEFLIKELNSNFKTVLNALYNATNIYDVSCIVLAKFENPKNQSEAVKKDRANRGQKYFDLYSSYTKKVVDSTNNVSKKSIEDIAKEVINGKWSTGQERKDKLAAAGYDYAEVQNMVNKMLGSSIKVEPVPKFYPKYVGNTNSVVEALNSVGCEDSSLTFRKKIANKNHIANYSGTVKQNTQMLKLLKAGMLLKP